MRSAILSCFHLRLATKWNHLRLLPREERERRNEWRPLAPSEVVDALGLEDAVGLADAHLQFDVMPTSTFGQLKDQIVEGLEDYYQDDEDDYYGGPNPGFLYISSMVEAATLIYVDDGTRNEIAIARDTLVITGPISHGCILTLDIDVQNDSAAFKVELDPDYK